MTKRPYRRRSPSNSRKAYESPLPRELTPAERARNAKFGATLVGMRSPAFDEAADRRQAAEEDALRLASMSEAEMLAQVVPSEAMSAELLLQKPPQETPKQK